MNLLCTIRQSNRFFRLMKQYPMAAEVWLMSFLRHLPMFTFKYVRHSVRNPQRSGFADGHSTCTLHLSKILIWEKQLPAGQQLTAYHFYFARPVKHFFKNLPAFDYKQIVHDGRILEIGCGAGRFIGNFVDLYGGAGVGVDLYQPALDVANSSILNDEIEFRQLTIETGEEVVKLLPEDFSVVLFSSSLVHLPDENKCRVKLVNSLKKHATLIIGHEQNSPQLIEELLECECEITQLEKSIVFFWKSDKVESAN